MMTADQLLALGALKAWMLKVRDQDRRSTVFPTLFVVQSLAYSFYSEAEERADYIVEVEKDTEQGVEQGYDHFDYIDSAWFFTMQGAQEHIVLNINNYNRPRVLVRHCFRSPEVERLFEYLSVLTEVEVKNSKK